LAIQPIKVLFDEGALGTQFFERFRHKKIPTLKEAGF
jgi:hypothetical protein